MCWLFNDRGFSYKDKTLFPLRAMTGNDLMLIDKIFAETA